MLPRVIHWYTKVLPFLGPYQAISTLLGFLSKRYTQTRHKKNNRKEEEKLQFPFPSIQVFHLVFLEGSISFRLSIRPGREEEKIMTPPAIGYAEKEAVMKL